MSLKHPITFFTKNATICPGCQTSFYKEELQTGRGRINAGTLTDELRRLYIPTQKYGVVNPLIYPILVCPSCLFAGMLSDFKVSPDSFSNINEEEENRHTLIQNIFKKTLDFTTSRDTIEGLASYILAFSSTIHLPRLSSPTARRGLYSLRAAWLAHDLYEQSQLEYFKDLSDSLYFQSFLNYDQCLEKQLKNIEPFDGFIWMGPDVDTNYGYDGLLYTIAYLSIRFLEKLPINEQIIKLGNIKRITSKIFGIGKSNKNKPQILVSNAKLLYAKANTILEQLQNQGIDIQIAAEIEQQEV